jgi:DNA-binding CsgD family transcriptional regulator
MKTGRPRNDKLRSEVKALRSKGVSYKETAKRLGIKESSVLYYSLDVLERYRQSSRTTKVAE